MHDAASLLAFLNLQEKGADTIIIHAGSHSVKFGLASQIQPFIAPNVIAYPRKNGKKIFDIDAEKARETQRQAIFDYQIEKVLPEIEHQLRKKRFLLIDAKSAKNIRNKQVSFKIFDENNSVNEYNEVGEDSYSLQEHTLLTSDLSPNLDKFAFINMPETTCPETHLRPTFVGREALALHRTEEYVLRYPIKYGDLNVSETYSIHDCIQDQQTILETLFQKYMRLPKKNLEQFNCILVIPDILVKHHLRYIVTMLLGKLRFKSIFMHTESVMATFAMAMSTACVVDIGSSKINICCIEEGLLVPKSIQRRHFGGDELNEILYRMINRQKAMHYFPRNIINPDYHYHKMLLEYVKENYSLTEMDQGETVKTCQIKIKDKLNARHRKCCQLTFNCSDSLLLAPQSMFYSQIMGVLLKIKNETTEDYERTRGDPLQIAESFQDPDDLMHDIIQGMNAQASGANPQGIMKQIQTFVNKAEETPGNTPSASNQDLQSEMGDETELNGDKFSTSYSKMQEPIDLDELICKSICTTENGDVRKRMANSIILVGGVSKIRKFTDSLEEAVMDRFSSGYDNTIERVNVELYNVQQHQQYQQHQALLQASGQLISDAVPDHLKIDPRFTSWIGASIIPKLESSKDMFIQRDKFILDFKPYKENFQEQKQLLVQQALEQKKVDQEEKKSLDTVMLELSKETYEKPSLESGLSVAQIEQIEKELGKKLKKDRTFEAGMKQVRERAPFHL